MDLEELIKLKFPNLSKRKFSELAGIPSSTLQSMINRGIENASVVNVIKVAKTLDMDVEELMNYKTDINHQSEEKIYIDFDKYNKANIIKEEHIEYLEAYKEATDKHSLNSTNFYGSISAGEPTSIEGVLNAEQINLPKVMLGKYADRDGVFLMKVNGESMNRIIPNGSYVACVPVEPYELKDKDIVIYSKNNESSMKRYRKTPNAIIFSPESTYDDFFDVVVPNDTTEDVRIHAKVILYTVALD